MISGRTRAGHAPSSGPGRLHSLLRPAPLGPKACLAVLACAAAVTGCSSTSFNDKVLGVVTPYRMEIVQGNVVTSEMFENLREGMTRDQVRAVLGTPLLTDIFHADRWDYVFTLRRQGAEPQQRRVTVFFDQDRVSRLQADALPTERAFVAAINVAKPDRNPPALELDEAALSKLPLPKASAEPVAAEPAASGPRRAYPPLEPVNP